MSRKNDCVISALYFLFGFASIAGFYESLRATVTVIKPADPFIPHLLDTKGVNTPFSSEPEALCFFYCSGLLSNPNAASVQFMKCNTQIPAPNPTHPAFVINGSNYSTSAINAFEYFRLALYLCGAPGQIGAVNSTLGGSTCDNNSPWSKILQKALYGLHNHATTNEAVALHDGSLMYGVGETLTWLKCFSDPAVIKKNLDFIFLMILLAVVAVPLVFSGIHKLARACCNKQTIPQQEGLLGAAEQHNEYGTVEHTAVNVEDAQSPTPIPTP